MADAADTSIVIPAYNEAASIAAVVADLRTAAAWREIVVIDDGSTDATRANAEAAGARVVRHPYNKGNGAAVKTGIRQAQGTFVLIVDADGQHQPGDARHNGRRETRAEVRAFGLIDRQDGGASVRIVIGHRCRRPRIGRRLDRIYTRLPVSRADAVSGGRAQGDLRSQAAESNLRTRVAYSGDRGDRRTPAAGRSRALKGSASRTRRSRRRRRPQRFSQHAA